MSLRHSEQKFKMLVPALVLAVLFGISAGAMILMFQGSQCETPYSEGSLPALLCPAPSDSPSLR
ncbi:hypothetical protein VC841_23240 [Citrobacter freundii]|nr:hypothetical protein [Citrobacter freundii]